MSGSVDDRIVQMSFDNKQFESGVSTSMGTLAKLKSALDFSNSSKSLGDLQDAGNKFSLAGLGVSIDGISGKLAFWGTVGVTALSNIVTQGIDAATRLAKAFTVDPISAGLTNYETQINAIQTILANTSQKGTNIDDVNKALAELNTYANQTVYNFAEMTKNIGTFTAAGVDLDTSVNAIKGIANLAALSGSSSDQAASAMYQLSQAIAAGQVKLQDWNSVVNAGIGGQVFQKALYNTAVQFGTIKNAKVGETFEQWTAAGNSFRNSLQDGWLTSKVLTSTLSQFTGDMTDAQLAAQGFSKDQIAQIQQLGKTANASAVNIKTLSQLQQALKEEVATAYAAIFKTIFGNLDQATKLFSKIHTVAENALTNPIYALDKLLQGAADLGARDKAIDAFTNAFHALSAILTPIKQAFREIFPPETAQELANLIAGIDNLSKGLIIGASTADKIKRTFAGVFAVFDIGRQLVVGLITVIRTIFDEFAGGPTAILGATASLGDWLVAIDKALVAGGKIQVFFSRLSDIVAAPIEFIKALGKGLVALFADHSIADGAKAVGDNLGRVTDRLEPFKKVLEVVEAAWGGFVNLFGAAAEKLQPYVQGIVDAFDGLGEGIENAFKTGNFNGIFDVINTTLLGGILLLVKKFFSQGIGINIGGGVFGQIKDILGGLSGQLQAMQQNIKADTLLKIAAAIGLITISVVALSLIDSDKLTKALTAMAVGFGELLGAMAILVKVSGSAGFVKVPVIAGSMVLLAAAIDLLVIALVVLAQLDWDQIAKGLAGLGGLLLELTLAVKPMSENAAGMIRAGLGITAIAVALDLLAIGMKIFATMSWEEIGKGLATVAGLLAAVTTAANFLPPSLLLAGPGLLAVALAINVLAGAVALLGQLDPKTIEKGLLALAGGLAILVGAVQFLPVSLVLTGPALIAVAVAMNILAGAIAIMGNLGWDTIGKGLFTLGAAMTILAVGLTEMDASLPGAIALVITAGALALLTPQLVILGKLSWTSIIKGLVSLAGALAVIALAALATSEIIPALLGLGVAVLALGAGFALIGAGAFLFATALSLLSSVGSAGIAVLLAAIEGLIAEIPDLATNLAEGLIAIVQTVADATPQFIAAFEKILDGLLQLIEDEVPKLVEAIGVLLQGIFDIIEQNTPRLVSTGLFVLTTFLSGIANNIGLIVTNVALIIVNFLNALAAKLPDIIAAGANVLVQFLQGIADHIADAVGAGIDILVQLLVGVAKKIPDVVAAGTDIIVQLLKGVGAAIPKIVDAAGDLIIQFITALATEDAKIVTAAFQAILSFLDALDNAINTYEPQIITEAGKIGVDIVKGIVNGLGGIVDAVANKLKKGLGDAISKAASYVPFLGGPAHMIGEPIMDQIGDGIDNNNKVVTDSLTENLTDALNAASDTLSKSSIDVGGIINTQPVITPVLDLTNVTKDAATIPSLLSDANLNVGSSLDAANAISDQTQAAALQQEQSATTPGETTQITFEQYNTSPKSLSAIDIYRQTKNQLALAKEALSA